VTRQLIPNVAVGLPALVRYQKSNGIVERRYRYLFITPWRNSSLVGTFEAPHTGHPDEFRLTDEEAESFIEDVNAAFPAGNLSKDDVRYIFGGFVPANADDEPLRAYTIRDHGLEDGVKSFISVCGVKYTTARHVAENVVHRIQRKLGRRPEEKSACTVPVHGGAMRCFDTYLERELQNKPSWISKETLVHLIRTYGSEYRNVLRYCDQDPKWRRPVTSSSPVIQAEILHAIYEEMACKPDDVLYRRTELGADGYPGDACVNSCADIMSRQLKSRQQPNASTYRP